MHDAKLQLVNLTAEVWMNTLLSVSSSATLLDFYLQS